MLEICHKWNKERIWMRKNHIDVEKEFPEKVEQIDAIILKYKFCKKTELTKILNDIQKKRSQH